MNYIKIIHYTFSFISFNVFLNKNHGCNNRRPPIQYVIFGPIDQYTEKQTNTFGLTQLKIQIIGLRKLYEFTY